MLAKEGYYNLDILISEALLSRPPDFSGIHTCSSNDTLGSLLDAILKTFVRRFVVIRDECLIGIISLSDILKYMIKLS